MNSKQFSFEMEPLAGLAAAWPEALGEGCVIEAGLSGGLDSVVLLHVLAALRPHFGFKLQAVHVHHGLSEKADEWARFCQAFCAEWAVPLRVEKVRVDAAGLGVEAAARKARYQAFEQSNADILVLAHHRGDQVETFLLAAMRGGGIRALAAMPTWRHLNENIRIWRPLLSYDRAELTAYAEANSLNFIDDESNQDSALLRNWLRNEALPQWRGRLPHLDAHIVRSVAALQDELALLAEVVDADWALLHQTGEFDVACWRQLSEVRRRQQLLKLAKMHGLGTPRHESIDDFARILYTQKSGQAEWRLPCGMAYAYRNRLFAQTDGWQSALPWLEKSEKHDGRLKNLLMEKGFTLQRHLFGLSEEALNRVGSIRVITTDDSINLTVGRKNVGKFLQECGVPPFVRKYWPIVTDSENRCLAIANVWVNVHYGCRNGFLPVFDEFNRFILEPK